MTLETDLQNEKVIYLDLNKFTLVESGTSVRDTISKMRKASNNCAFITKDGALIGIFTDRDVLRKVVSTPEVWDNPIDEVMTASPDTVNSQDPAAKALAMMDEKRYRNVPVINDAGEIVGNMTHYAVIKYLSDHFPESVYNLPPDPNQVASNRDGA